MNRRRLLQLAGAAGLTGLWPRAARAGAAPYEGPFYVLVQAGGGWDTTMLCDPKGQVTEDDIDPVNHFFVDEIEEVGPFRLAPVGISAFFERFRDDLLVINGIDCQTVSHVTGERNTWSGSPDTGMPSFGALVSAAVRPRPALPYLTNGGYDHTAGLIAPTRLADTDAIRELAWPHRLDVDDPDSAWLAGSGVDRLAQARADRLARLRGAASLPRVARSHDMLAEARASDNELARVVDYLPDALDGSNALLQQAQVAMACFKAGVTVAANCHIGGFDTHGDHDALQTTALVALMDGLGHIMDEAERQGIADQIVLLVSSEFGRTPSYNDTDGKDHWSVTSMLAMGPGIRGGRVVGATTDGVVAESVDPVTLALDPDGVNITAADVHASLRELTGISADPVAVPYPVGSPLPLFT